MAEYMHALVGKKFDKLIDQFYTTYCIVIVTNVDVKF